MIGIYKITCTKNRLFYVGSSFDIPKRWLSHTDDLTNKTHHNYRIQRDFDKFGLVGFKFEIIHQVTEFISRKDLLLLEQGYIDTLNPKYNIRRTTGCDEVTQKRTRKRRRISNTIRPRKRRRQFAHKAFKNMYAR